MLQHLRVWTLSDLTANVASERQQWLKSANRPANLVTGKVASALCVLREGTWDGTAWKEEVGKAAGGNSRSLVTAALLLGGACALRGGRQWSERL